jgi:crotonobetainyl-CoA:carnitine CoA-transferase CaiB-like acyl-CoA transferase
MDTPLDGLVVADFTRVLSGPHCTRMLSDLGATVIKVEPPAGDVTRFTAPRRHGMPSYYAQQNTGKLSVSIDLRRPEGGELAMQLCERADILVENFRPDVMERFGLHYDAVAARNPRIVYASITGYGATGPWKDRRAYAPVVQAETGLTKSQGDHGRGGVYRTDRHSHADVYTSLDAAAGVLAALYQRERTGRGCRVETSMFDGMLNLLSYMGTHYLSTGEVPTPQGSAHEFTVPWQAFPASDGYVVIATRQENFWRKLCGVLGDPALTDDPRFATNPKRIENRALLVPMLEDILRTRTVSEWLEKLRAAEVPAAPVNNLDGAFAEPPVAEREMIVEYDHPDVGRVRLPGNPIKFEGMGRTISHPAPRLGEHTDAVLRELLSLPAARIAELRAQGVIK